MNQERITAELKKALDEKRFKHILGVRDTAVEMAIRFDADVEQAALAALLHDCAKNLSFEELFSVAQEAELALMEIDRQVPELLHGPVGAVLASNRYEVKDEVILEAIRSHTLGSTNMSVLDKIIYIADMIEPGRDYPAVASLREVARKDLDEALLACFDQALHYVINNGFLIHPRTIEARNAIIWSKRR